MQLGVAFAFLQSLATYPSHYYHSKMIQGGFVMTSPASSALVGASHQGPYVQFAEVFPDLILCHEM